ncbi:hypothetical protein [Streptomyces alkaliphilus]|uniref:hypothetical protein n=1 Tax=Streptomyces alkaliphilus TaxID=1472722 RepID=UPI001E62477A|nr:hypothetical protein [Streptomyces alkaliphilus]
MPRATDRPAGDAGPAAHPRDVAGGTRAPGEVVESPAAPAGAGGPAGADGPGERRTPDIPGEAAPEPLGTPLEPTGHAAVDALVERLWEVDRLAVTAHPAVYEDVHRGLDGILAALDRPAGPRPAGAPTDLGS